MKPTLPTHINPKNGQCLPAAVALLFNDPSILRRHKAQPKKNGHLITELAHFLPDGVWFGLLGSEVHFWAEFLATKFRTLDADSHLIPIICNCKNHSFLSIFDTFSHDMYYYDTLNNKCGVENIHIIDFYNVKSMWGLTDPETNAILSLTRDEVSHLIEF